VLIQSFHPEHYALEYAREQVYEKFYKREITFRQGMHYPPVVALINIIVHHAEYKRAAELAATIAKNLREVDSAGQQREFRVLGPALAPLARLRGEHRLQILIKTRSRKRAREALDQVLEQLNETAEISRNVSIEVDPVSLM
jgi:primosomal protein N' (replication factor Y)